ncbi:hypothetical protein Y032_0034g2873 [Ancylostoma ceylanicum]|nr:hypothetical protein Y032_0034g2873 [Ancylostoma ceylanicum]
MCTSFARTNDIIPTRNTTAFGWGMLRCEEYFMSRLKIHPLLKSEDVTALPMTNLIIIGISLAILGVAAGALYIPTFQSCLDAVKEHGYDDSFRTYGCVSGVFQSAFAFG